VPKKIRVYELARELGLTNKEALDLCVSLGIGVKSHSSSIEDAQADRVRRKADSEGLRRAVQPEDPAEEKAAAAKAAKAPAHTPAAPAEDAGAPSPTPSTPPVRPERSRLITSRPASEVTAPLPPSAPRPLTRPTPTSVPAPANNDARVVGAGISKSSSRRSSPRTTPSNAPVPDGEVIIERGSTAARARAEAQPLGRRRHPLPLLQGEMVTATQSLSDDMIELFAAEIGAQIRWSTPARSRKPSSRPSTSRRGRGARGGPAPAPAVVTVMGHVDHGKTLLLDKIRSTNVVAGEAGGITQHIGAYQVEWNGHRITFIDTPGPRGLHRHAGPGAEVTDIVVLVVAADDGVMPQTVEAIDHAKAADVPIVVAVNKIDRPTPISTASCSSCPSAGSCPRPGAATRSWSRSRRCRSRDRRPARADHRRGRGRGAAGESRGPARGAVLEANLEAGRGPVATVIVQSGTLRVGDPIVAGAAWGKVKALVDDRGDQVKEALPRRRYRSSASPSLRRRRRIPGHLRPGDGPHHR
jgi:translation initiation factor IF-2